MFDLEKALTLWLRSFRKYRAFDHGAIREMELHLRDHMDDLLAEGHSEQQAFEMAVAEFGEISPMADEEFSNIKSKTTISSLIHTAMFKNYSKVSIRSLMRNPLNSFINIFGLSVAIGLAIFVYAYIQWVHKTDQFHENKEKVQLVTFFADRDGSSQQFAKTPRPLAEMLKNDFSNIEKVCRIEDRNVVVKHEDNVFHEGVRFTDPEFLEMFTFPLKWGTAASLKDMNSIILSEKMSVKYFGEENPVGRDILLKFDETRSKAFKVAGVAQKFPVAHTIDFNFLINFENLRISAPEYDFHDWNQFVNATFIQLAEPADITSLEQGMEKYKLIQNKAVDKDWAISSFGFEPLATLHKRSGDIRDGIARNSADNLKSIYFLSFVVAFMLILACMNYINIAIVSSTKRLKEIGVRKTIGASRKVIIIQFLTENIVVTSFALLLGVLIGFFLFIPWFEGLWGFSMGFSFTDPTLWIYLSAILLFTALISGSYPAFYISSFKVTGILKGSLRFGQKNPLTKLLLGFQLVLACIFITAAVTFSLNTNYLSKRSWGYDNRQALFLTVPDYAGFEKMKAVLGQDPSILSISGSEHHIGKSHATSILKKPDRQFEVDQLSVDANYFQTMGIDLSEGRVFKEDYESDKNKIVVNETFVSSLGLKDPLGELYKIDTLEYEIIGVVNDFHSYSFSEIIKPGIFKLADKKDYIYLSLRVVPGSERETYKAIQATWIQLYPEIPFDGGYQEAVWGNYYEQIAIHAEVWQVFAAIAILLACLGLYGLVTLNVAGRVKEFSIRKTLGAGVKNIAINVSRQYIILFSLAIVIGAPISLYLMKLIFSLSYRYHVPITYEIIVISVAILVLVFLLTISTQIRKVLVSNPVEGLKVE
ncbi:ABC transporter permease [Marivirga sp. S37H4]|uniref:ABC transporter permease n=1 Tax=Marivirga aurantiaca TaxID=2802615 RepID=A0A935CBW6_9BACT|nr:ABC transporter permease [Marivirga aurantiaca]MBK6267309.1 ABC transporter permease [Marivirga aurantiaca]